MIEALDLDPSKPLDLSMLQEIHWAHTFVFSWWLLIPFVVIGLPIAAGLLEGLADSDHPALRVTGGVAAGILSGTVIVLLISGLFGWGEQMTATYEANEAAISAWAEGRYGLEVDDAMFEPVHDYCDDDSCVRKSHKGTDCTSVEFMLDDGTVVTNKIVGHRMILVKSGDSDELPVIAKEEVTR